MSLLDSAIAFGAQAHADHRRRYDGLPYITHPIHVMMLLWDADIRDEEMLIAAVLHDVVEDTPVGFTSIYRRFGAGVEGLVRELTDEFTKAQYPDLNRAERKRRERERIALTSPRAQSIKYADFISNTQSIVKHDPGFARRYLEEKEATMLVIPSGNALLRAAAYAALKQGQETLVQHSLKEKDDAQASAV